MITFKLGCENIKWEQLSELYKQVGLVAGHGKKGEAKLIEQAFRASFKVVSAWDDSKLIGAGRVLSDGLCYSAIFDIGVLPEFQRSGVGRGLMQELMNGLEHTCFHLTATFGNEEFYKKLGFKRHKTAMAKYPNESNYLE